MRRVRLPRPIAPVCAAALAALLSGCGQEIAVPEGDPLRAGAEIFNERCSGCHTLDAAAAAGSKAANQGGSGERTDGPNFNTRQETPEDVLYAIRNGGFSGAIMPANIAVGRDAEVVAAFVAKYAGRVPDKGVGPDQGGGVQPGG